MQVFKSYKLLIAIIAIPFLAACSSSSTSSSGSSTATTREVTGSVPESSNSISSKLSAVVSGCAADTVIATDTDGSTTLDEVDTDCAFVLELEVGKSYVVSLSLDDEFIATVIFDPGFGFGQSDFMVTADDDAIDLGVIAISGTTATPTSNPLDQIDTDDDGTVDSEDEDANGDGTEDAKDTDCDLDGIPNTIDTSECATDDDPTDVVVLEVHPLHGQGVSNEDNDNINSAVPVEPDEAIKARINCVLDQTLIDINDAEAMMDDHLTLSGSVLDTNGSSDTDAPSLSCSSFELTVDESTEETILTCNHTDVFYPNTTYTVNLYDLVCEDGTAVETGFWQFQTEASDLIDFLVLTDGEFNFTLNPSRFLQSVNEDENTLTISDDDGSFSDNCVSSDADGSYDCFGGTEYLIVFQCTPDGGDWTTTQQKVVCADESVLESEFVPSTVSCDATIIAGDDIIVADDDSEITEVIFSDALEFSGIATGGHCQVAWIQVDPNLGLLYIGDIIDADAIDGGTFDQ